MTNQSFKEKKIAEFDEKYGSFELCEVINKKDRDRLLAFLSESIDQAIEGERKRLGKDVNYAIGRIQQVMEENKAMRPELEWTLKMLEELFPLGNK